MTTEGTGAATNKAKYIRGVPHPLPAGEHVLWEGAPDPNAMATHVFHRRLFLLYFAAMITWWGVTTSVAFGSSDFIASLGVRVGLSAIVLGVVEMLARVSARTTWYAITNKRIVLKIGMVIPMSINIPFQIVDSAGVGMFKDGTGQLAVVLGKGHRLAYIALWPHCRVFELDKPSPILRGLRDAQHVGGLLANAVAAVAAVDDDTRIERTTSHGLNHEPAIHPQPVGV